MERETLFQGASPVLGLVILSLFLTSCGAPPAPTVAAPPADVAQVQGSVYYVSPSGSDSYPGTADQPWRTLQRAAGALVAGDTVYIKSGTYRERVVPENSGNPDRYITYAAHPGDAVTIDGQGVTVPEWGGLFDLSERNYVRVSGLRVVNSGSAGQAGHLHRCLGQAQLRH